jgi:hypothetical protein
VIGGPFSVFFSEIAVKTGTKYPKLGKINHSRCCEAPFRVEFLHFLTKLSGFTAISPVFCRKSCRAPFCLPASSPSRCCSPPAVAKCPPLTGAQIVHEQALEKAEARYFARPPEVTGITVGSGEQPVPGQAEVADLRRRARARG